VCETEMKAMRVALLGVKSREARLRSAVGPDRIHPSFILLSSVLDNVAQDAQCEC